jgi:hypothetical protein
MNRSPLALLILLTVGAGAYSQSVARVNQAPNSGPEIETKDGQILAAHAIASLKRLGRDVVFYRSLADFEAGGRLARVPFETFANDLQVATTEVESVLSRLPQSKLKAEIRHSLDAYRDGMFWWEKIYQPRVLRASALTSANTTRTSSDATLLATVPYTIAINWRQANRYLNRAEALLDTMGK